MIVAVVVFLFGGSKIPQIARSLGQARREFDNGWKGVESELTKVPTSPAASAPVVAADPLTLAAQNEGIETQGKTREQIASELSWKLSKK